MHRARTGRWLVMTLPIAPLAAVAYLFSEWLFFATKPSPTSALPFGEQLLVLWRSPERVLLPLLLAQLVASLASLVAFPRIRGVALLPGATILGFLALVLIDNFAYTVFGIGIVNSGEVVRVAFAACLPVLAVGAGWKLDGWLVRAGDWQRAPTAAAAITVLLAASPLLMATEKLPRQPDASLLPALAASTKDSERPNILFLGVDGIDAAITSAYGYERETTPFLASIREDTLMFENAFSNVARTHGSLVTLLTGRLPFSTHVTFPPTLLQGQDGERTLPMLLKSLGYGTLQLGMRHYADAEDTNVGGFDAANYHWQRLEEIGHDGARMDGTDVFRTAVAERIDDRLGRLFGTDPVADAFAHVEGRQIVPQWRDERRVTTLVQYIERAPEPWFVHLHMLDTHCCHWTPSRTYFSGGPSSTIDSRDSQLRESDNNIRTLFETLASTGRLERTIVVISSDHASEWKTTERVPLMIRFPHRQHTGRVQANVQIADVAPTMLSYLGADVPAWMDGQSLLPSETLPETRPIFAISELQATGGPAGHRTLREEGSGNFGASAVMMVIGAQLFELDLASGGLTSRRVGDDEAAAQPTRDGQARRILLERLRSAGFTVGDLQLHASLDPPSH